jgi:amino acid transporter
MSEASSKKGFKRVMRSLDMTLFTVCAILVIDTIAPSAAIGPSTISWWIITLLLFFIPYGLITAELGTTYPEQGGLYVWINRAFGGRWAARTTWLYWINVALWMPAVYILFAGMFAQLFAPDLGLWAQILIGIVMTWITVAIGCVTLETSKWVPNIGAIFKAVIMVVLGVAGFVYASRNGIANDLSLSALLPKWDAGLFFLPVIVYNFMGFELMSGAGEELKEPGKTIPRAIILSGILIAVFYLLGTVGMLVALPLDDLGLVEGIIDTFLILFGEGGLGGAFVVVLGIMALYSFFANMVTWTMGANKTAAEAAGDGELPKVFGKLHPVNKTPVNAFLITGIVSTIVIILYGFMAGTAEDLFWTLFAFSSMVFLLPYLVMFPAYLKLRDKDKDIERPYRLKGPRWFLALLVVICELFIVQAVVFFVWVPGEPVDWAFAAPVLIGVVLTLVVGEFLIKPAQK